MKKTLLAALALTFASTGAWALTADGVTYTLTEQLLNSTTADFTLVITGINGPSDTEGGRSGVQSFAFTTPSNSTINFAGSSAPTGYTLQTGGLASSGCTGSGGFFCFASTTNPFPTSPALAANSSLSFSFEMALASGSFANYSPDFKINWDGSKNNYDLVSQPLAATPLPASWTMMLSVLVMGVGFAFYQGAKRRNGAQIAAA